jgi:gamma-glutamyltranspeptidase
VTYRFAFGRPPAVAARGMVATSQPLATRVGFAVSGAVEPGRRPYRTIIPGTLPENGSLLGPFGVMGGFIQAQAHMQLVFAIVDDGLDPQAALDRPYFRVDGDLVPLEEGLWEHDADLEPSAIGPCARRTRSASGAARRSSFGATRSSAAPTRARTGTPPVL